MKDGARSLIPAREGSVFTDNAWSTLGVGWLGACIVLSGSPVAASSLTLLDGGAIDRTQSFAMLTGTRLGASFVVLLVGVGYAMRRRAGGRAPLWLGRSEDRLVGEEGVRKGNIRWGADNSNKQ